MINFLIDYRDQLSTRCLGFVVSMISHRSDNEVLKTLDREYFNLVSSARKQLIETMRREDISPLQQAGNTLTCLLEFWDQVPSQRKKECRSKIVEGMVNDFERAFNKTITYEDFLDMSQLVVGDDWWLKGSNKPQEVLRFIGIWFRDRDNSSNRPQAPSFL